MADGPTISVLTPVYNTPPALLGAAIDSVVAQSYPRWELCLAFGGSTDPGTRRVLDHWAARDRRVRVWDLGENRGISGNSNAALAMARGEFAAIFDHDDLLHPEALEEV